LACWSSSFLKFEVAVSFVWAYGNALKSFASQR
jgi:hypothetical protein